jgi:proteasome accessory factor B
MSAQRTERMLNLVIALLATRRWLTKEQIRRSVPQYGQCASTDAFDRMFERDKEELRELGVPIETGSFDPVFDDEPGYRIDAEAYALPAIDFTPAELTVLGLAARVWQQASLAGPAARGLVKLKSLGVPVDESSLVGVEPRVLTTEPAFAPLYAATRDRAPVSFDYLKDGQTHPQRRTVEPWRISSWHGRWYLHGFDRDRGADRVFRLSRVRGSIRRAGAAGTVQVPAGMDTRAAVRRVGEESSPRTARVALDPHTGLVLRRQAGADPTTGVIDVQFSDLDDLAGHVAALGAHAEVLAPADLRAAVLALLQGAAAAHRHVPPGDPGGRR